MSGLFVVTAYDGRGLDAEGEGRLERFLAQAPVVYRDLSIVAVSFRTDPHYFADLKREGLPSYVYCGYTLSLGGTNVAPGATWTRTVGQAKTMIDVIHEVGGLPPLTPFGLAAAAEHHRIYGRWADRFWEAYRSRG